MTFEQILTQHIFCFFYFVFAGSPKWKSWHASLWSPSTVLLGNILINSYKYINIKNMRASCVQKIQDDSRNWLCIFGFVATWWLVKYWHRWETWYFKHSWQSFILHQSACLTWSFSVILFIVFIIEMFTGSWLAAPFMSVQSTKLSGVDPKCFNHNSDQHTSQRCCVSL